MATNARSFASASNAKVTCATGSVGAFGGDTIAAVIKLADLTTVKSVCSAGTDPNSWAMFIDTDESLGFYNGSSVSNSAASLLNGTDWFLVAVTKTSGNAIPRMHVFNYTTDAWSHTATGATLLDSPAPTTVFIGADTGGGTANDFNGTIQVVGYWTSVLTDPQIETLHPTLAAWEALSPAALWPLNQASTATAVLDTIGAADQTALTATTVVTGNPEWDDSGVAAAVPTLARSFSPIPFMKTR